MNRKFQLYGIYLVLLLVIIIIAVSYTKGHNQNEAFKEKYMQYEYAVQLLDKNQDINKSISMLENLQKEYSDRFMVNYQLGRAYMISQNTQKAAEYFQKAIELRPFLVTDPIFTYQYGEMLYRNGEFGKAKAYLDQSQSLPDSEKVKDKVAILLNEIEQKLVD